MKIIYPNRISSLEADTEAPEYPASNMLDDKPLKVWKGQASSGYFTIVTSGAVNGLFLCNTNADSYTMVVSNLAGTSTYETRDGDYYKTRDNDFTGGRVFIEFVNTYAVPVKITLSVVQSHPISVAYAGILRCGIVLDLPDPQYGLKSERQDFSIKSEYSNGGMYVYKRQTPRMYDLSMILTHAEFESLDGLYNAIGSAPVPILISESIERPDYWSGFFHVIDPPSGGYAYPNHIDCSLSLREAV